MLFLIFYMNYMFLKNQANLIALRIDSFEMKYWGVFFVPPVTTKKTE